MAYFSLGQLLANIDETKKAFNQANYVLSESGLWIPVRASNAGEVFAQLKGSRIVYAQWLNAVQVLAGATYNSGYIDLTDCMLVSVSAKAADDASHDWVMSVNGGEADGFKFFITSVSGVGIDKGADVLLRFPYINIQIRNEDTVAHTYHAWYRAFAGI